MQGSGGASQSQDMMRSLSQNARFYTNPSPGNQCMLTYKQLNHI
jgi:hypothetical protein